MRSVAGIAKWSARRPWRAIFLWLAFVAAVAAAGVATGIKSLQNGAVGESAQGYELIDKYHAYTPAREYGYVHNDTLPARDPAFQSAVRDVAARMGRDLGDIQIRTASNLHAVLVVGQWTHPYDVDRLRASVLAAGAPIPR